MNNVVMTDFTSENQKKSVVLPQFFAFAVTVKVYLPSTTLRTGTVPSTTDGQRPGIQYSVKARTNYKMNHMHNTTILCNNPSLCYAVSAFTPFLPT